MELATGGPGRIGPFRIERRLGSGGMGTVYLARDEEEDRTVALKVLDPRLAESQGFFRRFEREARAGLRVDHENVVRTLDYGLRVVGESPWCYIAMEYVEGQTLRELLEELRVVPEALVLAIARQVAAGLAAIHAAGIVHRDVKPENVLVTRDHRVRIMDLGVAKLLDVSVVLTQEGQFAGSLHYAAPEQFGFRDVAGAAARGAPTHVDARTDLYALGVVLHELATGAHPFPADSAAAIVRAHLEQSPPAITDIVPDLSPFLSEVVVQLLEKDPARRFPSAEALSRVLDEGESSAWWAARQEDVRRRAPSIPRVPVHRETTLHGRDAELALLRDLWATASAGAGATVLLEGEAGIGKSRLVDAFLATLDAGACHVLYGSYAPSGGLGGLADAVIGRFGAARLDAALRQYLTVTPGLVAPFAALLRHEAPPEGSPTLAADALSAVFAHLLRGLAAERPLVWVVDDLHFASADARAVVQSLARALEGHRVLLVLTSRPPVPDDFAAALARTGTLRRAALGRLGAKDVVQLIRDALRNERLVEKLGLRIAEKSDGVPFFVFEMIRGLKEGQFVTQLADGSWVESRVIERIEVPSAVRDLIGVRIHDLAEDQRDLLDVAAVRGYEFEPELVAAVLERRPIAVLQDLARIERRSGVVRVAGRRYRFDHHQIQEVLLGDLPQPLREGYHALIAEAIEARSGAASKDPREVGGAQCVDLAEHFLGGNAGARAIRYLDAALDHLAARCAAERAVALADRALAVPGLLEGVARADVLLGKARRLHGLGIPAAERAAVDEARSCADASGDASRRARAGVAHGDWLRLANRLAESRAAYDEAATFAVAAGERAAEAEAWLGKGLAHQCEEASGEALAAFDRAVALAEAAGDRRILARALGARAATLHTIGRTTEAAGIVGRGIEIAREIGDREVEAVATGHLATLLSTQGKFDDARIAGERAIALAREAGLRRTEATACGNLGAAYLALGRRDEAEACYERWLAVARETGDVRGECGASVNLATIHYQRDRVGAAAEAFRRTIDLAREIGHRHVEAVSLLNLGLLEMEFGDHVPAREHLELAVDICRERGIRYPEGFAVGGLAAIALDAGDFEASRRFAAEALAIRRACGHRDGEPDSLVALGTAAAHLGDFAAARAAFEEALPLARTVGLTEETVRSLARLACLPGGDVAPLREELARMGSPRLSATAWYAVWRATGDPAHLASARERLDTLLANAPPDRRESMLANVRTYREIAEAAREHLPVAAPPQDGTRIRPSA